jgi:hypothetical protein
MNSRSNSTRLTAVGLWAVCLLAACGREPASNSNIAPTAFSQVPAIRLSFRYEADVPGPGDQAAATQPEERNAGIQADFDQNRAEEVLDKTLSSPDKKRVAAVYHRTNDLNGEYRLDMYLPDGKLLQKITPDTMAVYFPDTIQWSPDSTALAFVAMVRSGQTDSGQTQAAPNVPLPSANANEETPQQTATPTPSAPAVLTFRTQQIYVCDLDGGALKPLTQNEGKIYYYYVWSPDGSALATLVATLPEWNAMEAQAATKKEVFIPAGRPRIVEKNGRERLLDDAMTQVHPVWSPDSTKVAAAFDYQIRIYDAAGNPPTQSAVPLKNQLLISSQAYDRQLEQQAAAENSVANTEPQPATNNGPATTTLPDPSKLVSFNPIIALQWTSDDIVYFQTGYIKQYLNPADNRSSYLRWHRLVLSPQPAR